MITLGSERWTDKSPKITLTFEYEKQRSGANMQYRAKITVSTVTGGSYFGYPIYLKLSIGGELRETVTLKSANPSRWSEAITHTSAWYTVANKTTGTVPVSFNVYSGSGGDRSGTYSYEMGVDPAASKVSAPDGTLSTPLNLTVTRYNTGFTHTITYTCGSASGTVCTNASATTVAWNTSNGNVLALASQNTAGQTVSVTFTITTYSGTTVIGTDGTTVTMTIPDSVRPSLALSVTDDAGYLSTYGAYVQGYSRLRITATPTLAYGSPIKAYSVIADGKTYNYYSVETVTTGAIQGKGTLTVSAAVADRRSRSSGLVSKDITVLEYSKPSVSVNAYRCNSSGVADQEGAYMKIEVTSTISSLNGKNSATYKIVHSGGTLTGNGTSFTSTPLACDVSSIHNIEVTITDKLSSTTKAAVIPIAYTLLDFHSSGEGVAFGKVATREGFDCAMDAYFTGKVTVGNKLLVDLIYPVGSIYMSTNNVSPQTFFGGTWESLRDRFLIGAGDTYGVGAVGGCAEHTLTTDEMPTHKHDRITYAGNSAWCVGDDTGLGGSQSGEYVKRYYEIDHAITATSASLWVTNAVGGGKAHNNMPPYLAVYMWKRTQ